MSDTIKINGEDRTIAANGSVVPRRSWPDAQIKPGDDIEIVSPAPGG